MSVSKEPAKKRDTSSRGKLATYAWDNPESPPELELERDKWRDVPLDPYDVEKFYLSDVGVSLVQNHHLQIKTVVWLVHGIGFHEKGVVEPFWRWLAKRNAGKHFQFDHDGRIKLTLATDFYLLWKECSAWEKEREERGDRGDHGWWKHGVKLMARFQYWKFFRRDNWTTPVGRTPERQQKLRDTRADQNWWNSKIVFANGHFEKVLAEGREKSAGKGKRKHAELKREAAEEREREAAEEKERVLEAKKRRIEINQASAELAVRKRERDVTSKRAETERHNTIYLFQVDDKTPDNPPAWVEYAIKGGWHEQFEDRTTIKAGFTEKGEPTDREDRCTAVFGLTHTLDRYVHLVDDVVGRDVEKIVFEKLKEAGGALTTWIGHAGCSREHFYFDHRPGFGHAEVMKLCRRAFCDAVAPYVATPGDELDGSTSDQESTSC